MEIGAQNVSLRVPPYKHVLIRVALQNLGVSIDYIFRVLKFSLAVCDYCLADSAPLSKKRGSYQYKLKFLAVASWLSMGMFIVFRYGFMMLYSTFANYHLRHDADRPFC